MTEPLARCRSGRRTATSTDRAASPRGRLRPGAPGRHRRRPRSRRLDPGSVRASVAAAMSASASVPSPGTGRRPPTPTWRPATAGSAATASCTRFATMPRPTRGDEDELVAADPTDGIDHPDRLGQDRGDPAQDVVADLGCRARWWPGSRRRRRAPATPRRPGRPARAAAPARAHGDRPLIGEAGQHRMGHPLEPLATARRPSMPAGCHRRRAPQEGRSEQRSRSRVLVRAGPRRRPGHAQRSELHSTPPLPIINGTHRLDDRGAVGALPVLDRSRPSGSRRPPKWAIGGLGRLGGGQSLRSHRGRRRRPAAAWVGRDRREDGGRQRGRAPRLRGQEAAERGVEILGTPPRWRRAAECGIVAGHVSTSRASPWWRWPHRTSLYIGMVSVDPADGARRYPAE